MHGREDYLSLKNAYSNVQDKIILIISCQVHSYKFQDVQPSRCGGQDMRALSQSTEFVLYNLSEWALFLVFSEASWD